MAQVRAWGKHWSRILPGTQSPGVSSARWGQGEELLHAGLYLRDRILEKVCFGPGVAASMLGTFRPSPGNIPGTNIPVPLRKRRLDPGAPCIRAVPRWDLSSALVPWSLHGLSAPGEMLNRSPVLSKPLETRFHRVLSPEERFLL